MDRRQWHLITQFAVKDFKIRYTHSLLGYTWSILNPLIFCVIYYLVFSVFIRFDVPNYPGYLLLGIVLWTFFSEGSTHGVGSMLARGGLITKVAMPRQVVVYASVLSAGLTFVINLAVLGVLLRITGSPLTMAALVFPLQLIDLTLITLGVSLLLSCLHVRYRDVGYLWGVIVQIGFWLTPIIYQQGMIPEQWRWLATYNPLARIIQDSRQILIYGVVPEWEAMAKTTLIAITVMLAGLATFRRLQARVVEYY